MKKENDLLSKFCTGFCAVFCAVILAVVAAFVLTEKKEMSESENRVLAGMPKLTLSSVVDGSFMKNFESFLSDQFPFRDKVISLKTSIDILMGKREENEVYIGKNGFLFEKQTEFDKARVSDITASMAEFSKANKSIKTAAIISPNSSYILSEFLPSGVLEEDQKKQLEEIEKQLEKSNISFIDCLDAFEKEEDKTKLFYRTDHHWTTQAAYDVFLSLCKNWNLNTKKVLYSFYTVSETFQGTLSSSSGISSSFDEISICVPSSENLSYVISYEKDGKKTATFFDKEKLNHKNQYEVFLGGNYDKLVISTNVDNLNTLLIFKDSYANCMMPMFAPFFSKIVVVDPRYYSDNLSGLMNEYDFTHSVYIYNLNTFLSDTSLKDVLES